MPLVFVQNGAHYAQCDYEHCRGCKVVAPHRVGCRDKRCRGCSSVDGRWRWKIERPVEGTAEYALAGAIRRHAEQAHAEYDDRQSTNPDDYPAILASLEDVVSTAADQCNEERRIDIEEQGRPVYKNPLGAVIRRRIARQNARAIVKQAICQAEQGLPPFKFRRGQKGYGNAAASPSVENSAE